ncbi:hypothetical protein DRE_06040 [Drechslerella stenobrocha 248]|uniref:Ryanodine receptor Ryr domain-containing protein n=1 Tax=Drechslerella stenobrocha 248 TaxID=1043628 RepID=W7HYC8_9PEZI|nr:hypothetical protein DRE_06040 [Drechslerella stenobrocha 248]
MASSVKPPAETKVASQPSLRHSDPAPPLDPALRETLAQELYKRYKLSRLRMAANNEAEISALKESDASFHESWNDLADHLKQSTRSQADDVPRKLQLIGYSLAKADAAAAAGKQTLDAFSEEQLEFLGEVEHDRWVAERMKSGWQAAAGRDSTAQKTPFFVPYADLEQKWKDVDKDMVRCVPEVLAKAGYRIYRVKE